MKRIIILIALVIAAITAIGQVKVIDQKPIDQTAKIKIDMSFNQITQMQRAFYVRMKKEEVLYDTPFHRGKIDTMLNNLWTVHLLFENAMSVHDTIELTVVDGKYYQHTDRVDLITERQQLVERYNRMVAKYGELAIYENEFRIMKKRFEQISNWEKQIVGN